MKTIIPDSPLRTGSPGKKLLAAATLFAAMLLAVPSAWAVNQDTQATAYGAATGMELGGYSVDSTYNYGTLSLGQSVVIDKFLLAQTNYYLFAAGCRGAHSLHIEVYDSNWNLVASGLDLTAPTEDGIRGASSIVWSPFLTGTYHIRLTMDDCRHGGAGYVVRYGVK